MAPDRDLKDVEIFKAGTYTLVKSGGGTETVSYSESDVAELASNTNKLLEAKKHEPPAKLGHDDDQAFAKMAGLPSIGWARRVSARAGKLYADFSQVPAAIAEAIERGRYRHISAEIYHEKETDANFRDFVKGLSLRAVAFLGADIPVVKGMSPLMLANADGGRIITMEVFKMAEKADAMVHLNRHPLDAHAEMGKGDKKKQVIVHKQNPDDTYDVHEKDDHSQIHKAVPHADLSLMSEKFSEEKPMELKELQDAAAAEKAKAEKLAEENSKLRTAAREASVNAFAEKHKGLLKQPPILAAFKALAAIEAPAIKLAEGKEQTHLEAVMAFAEMVMKAKPVLFGEAAPSKEEAMADKKPAVAFAEAQFNRYMSEEGRGIEQVLRADIAVEAREMHAKSDGKKKYSECLLAVASTRLGKYSRGNYAEVEVA